jgi:hypothetical protein
MIQRILAAAFALLTTFAAHAEAIRGAWTMTPTPVADLVQVNLTRDHSQWGESMPLSAFSGLSAASMNSTSDSRVQFALRRDAGTVNFDGWFRDNEGVGHFTFVPNENYLATLRSMNVRVDDDWHYDDNEQLFRLAWHDVSTDFIRTMRSLGYDATLGTYVKFRIHGVTPRFVTDLRGLGYDQLSAQDLVRFRIHGASPDFIRALSALGYRGLSAEELVRFRIHGVSPDFIRDLNALGYSNIDSSELVKFRIHGVSAEFVRQLSDLGYKNVDAEDLVRMRIHGVTPDFIRELQSAGYRNVPVDKLVSMRIHGIDAKYLKAMSN